MQDRALRPGPQSSPHSRAEAPRARKALSRNHAPSRGPSPPEAKASAVLERNEVRLPYPLRGLRSSGPTMGDTALDYRIVADAFQRLPDLPYEVNDVTAKMELLLPKLDEGVMELPGFEPSATLPMQLPPTVAAAAAASTAHHAAQAPQAPAPDSLDAIAAEMAQLMAEVDLEMGQLLSDPAAEPAAAAPPPPPPSQRPLPAESNAAAAAAATNTQPPPAASPHPASRHSRPPSSRKSPAHTAQQRHQHEQHPHLHPTPLQPPDSPPATPTPSPTLLVPSSRPRPGTAAAAGTEVALQPASSSSSPLLETSMLGGLLQPKAGVVASGRRPERRKRNWTREAPELAARESDEGKYQTRGNNVMGQFMRTFTRDKLLNAEEERQLSEAAQDFLRLQGVVRVTASALRRRPTWAEVAAATNMDEATLQARLDVGRTAFSTLAKKNYRLVVAIAKKYVASSAARAAAGGGGGGADTLGAIGGGAHAQGGTPLEDVVAAGMEGLVTAIRKFQPGQGFRLATYATWWIRQMCGRFVAKQEAVYMLPESQRVHLSRVSKARATLRAANPTKNVTPEELAAATGLSLKKIKELEGVSRSLSVRSLEGGGGTSEEEGALADRLMQDTDGHMEDLSASGGYGPGGSPDSEEFVAQMDLTATFDELISSMDEKDQAVLDEVFGLGLGAALDVGLDEEEAAAGGPAAGGAGKEQGAKGASKGKAVAVQVEGGKAKVVKGGKSGGKQARAVEAVQEAEHGEEQGEAKAKRGKTRRAPSSIKALKRLRQAVQADSATLQRLSEHHEERLSAQHLPARTPGYTKKSG